MRRRLLTIAVCLLLGIATTIAVAWSGAAAIDLSTPTATGVTAENSDPRDADLDDEYRFARRYESPAATFIMDYRLRETTDMDMSLEFVEAQPSAASVLPSWYLPMPPQEHSSQLAGVVSANQFALATGWPMTALMSRGVETATQTGLMWKLDGGFDYGPAGPGMSPRTLPWRPMWPGFAVNALCFSVVWLSVMVGAVTFRRALHRRRGRCIMCGYDLRGELDVGCPECGWNRR